MRVRDGAVRDVVKLTAKAVRELAGGPADVSITEYSYLLQGDKVRSVPTRQQMPPIPLAGVPKPVVVHLDFDAETVDAMLERLSVLRAQMLPAPQRN